MKIQFVALSLLAALAAPALAGPCVSLDYQEMKDMSVDELVKEACKTNEISTQNLHDSIAAPSLSRAADEAIRDQEQCSGQVDRMLRILKSKGVTEKLYKLCEQQAQGHKIEGTETK